MFDELIRNLGTVTAFAFGLSVGSFLNVLIERVPRNFSIGGRSHCPHCFHELGVTDLVPLLSFVLLRSRCRYCQGPISWQYPAVEFFTGLLFVLVFLTQPLSAAVVYLILFSFLLVLFITDLKFGLVPTAVVYPAIIVALLARLALPLWESALLYWRLSHDPSGFGAYLLKAGFFSTHLSLQLQFVGLTLLGALAVTFFFFLIVVLTKKRGMGEGDIFYAFFVSLVAGFPNMFVAIITAFVSGALVSLLLVLLGRKRFGQTIPLGPFLSFGAFVAVFWGKPLVDFYLNLLK